MYKSPIEVLYGEMQTEIENDLLVKCSQTVGYNIDKGELIKALKYDRDQYEKGYSDGLNADKQGDGCLKISGNNVINKSCEICPECCEKLAERREKMKKQANKGYVKLVCIYVFILALVFVFFLMIHSYDTISLKKTVQKDISSYQTLAVNGQEYDTDDIVSIVCDAQFEKNGVVIIEFADGSKIKTYEGGYILKNRKESKK